MAKAKKSAGEWRVENWDHVTLAWLKSPEGAADRQLIKAAPDLLKLCRKALRKIGTNIMGDSCDPKFEKELRAAIAKADGRSA